MAHIVQGSTRLASGVITAALTPMNDDGSPNATLLTEHCRRLLDEGCSGVLLLGTTGEANSLTISERQAILEGVISGGIAPESLLVGTGCCAVGDTVTLTRHALSLGVVRILVLPPFYYKNVDDRGLFDAFASTIETVNDGRLRLFLYLIPQMTGIELSAELIAKLHDAFPTVVAGLKDSSGNWPATEMLCRRLGGQIDVMVGTEALLLRAMAAGASGCITAIANVAAKPIVRLFEKRKDQSAASLERGVNATRAAFESIPIIPALKTALAQTSGPSAWRNVRPPLRPLTSDESNQLMRRLRKSEAGQGT